MRQIELLAKIEGMRSELADVSEEYNHRMYDEDAEPLTEKEEEALSDRAAVLVKTIDRLHKKWNRMVRAEDDERIRILRKMDKENSKNAVPIQISL